jgi:thiol-disulfide isomerase/thioredoxin
MKPLTVALILGALAIPSPAAQPPVGSTSNNRNFAIRSGNTFKDADLTDYDGKILLIMMMTPWCPTCQSISQAVGDGILDHFSATSRGTLRGKNANGIEIHSILLSTEEAEGWDGVNASFANTNAFDQWGLDANAQRNNPRQNLG